MIWNGKNAKIIRVTPLGRYVVDVGDTSVMTYGQNLKKLEEKDMEDNTQAITIIRDGNKTLAIYTSRGGMTDITKTAVARCHPDDTYDFKAGADIVYKRLMGFPNVVETLKKENEDLKEQIRSYDGIWSNNADMINRNAELEERVKLFQNRNKSLSMSCNQWAENFAQLKRNKDTAVHNLGEEKANLKEQVDKQKEINKELVDENKKLKAEAGKLKSSNREIEIYDTVKIVNRGGCYSCREGFIRQYVPSVFSKFRMGDTPKNGDIGLIVAKAKPKDEKEMIYAILIDGQVYVMNERGIKLHNN